MKDEVYVCEISMTKLYNKKTKQLKYKEISKYPGIEKDLVFDVYVGENVEPGKKSIAYSLKFEDPSRTLTEDEVMQVFNKIINDVTTKLDAKLRDK